MVLAVSSILTCIRLLFRTDTDDLTGGARRGKGAMVTSHTSFVLKRVVSSSSSRSKRREKRFAIDGEEGPHGLIVRQDELEDAPDDQLPPRVLFLFMLFMQLARSTLVHP